MAKIMIVDDSTLILAVLEDALKKWGHEVFKAHDGYSVIPEFIKCKPDLVILDYNMPASSGSRILMLVAILRLKVRSTKRKCRAPR